MPVRKRVEFVSFEWTPYNKCRGTLTVKLDGNKVIFGPPWHKDKTCDYPAFWSFHDGIVFNEGDFPEELSDYYYELIHIFVNNVDGNHCGGCQ